MQSCDSPEELIIFITNVVSFGSAKLSNISLLSSNFNFATKFFYFAWHNTIKTTALSLKTAIRRSIIPKISIQLG